MSEPNYNETVVVPLLQKKVQDMSNQLLFLEANMLVQQARCKWLEERLAEAVAKAESASKRGKKKEEGSLDGQTY
jgi:hypothetical protein